MATAQPTLVTICIPTHSAKRLPYLREAVASARAQTHERLEILLSDDGNDAPVRQFAEEEMRADPRVSYTQNGRRLGLGGNWNAVSQRARGEYLVIIGDDDRLLPRFVETLLAARVPDTSVIFSNHSIIDGQGVHHESLTREFLVTYGRERLPAGELADPAVWVWKNSVPMLSALIRTADVQRLGIKTDLNTPEIELFARLAAEGKRFAFVPDSLAEYRVHLGSETSGGLASERLIPYLEPVPVPSHVEPLKRALIERLVVQAVNKALRTGEVGAARAMIRHGYYPGFRQQPARVAVQRTVAALPGPLSKWTYRMLDATTRRLREAARA